MKKILINEDTSVNWIKDYDVTALNMESYVFEIANDFCADDNLAIFLSEYGTENDIDEFEVSDMIRDIMFYDRNQIQFLLYSRKNNYLCGFVKINQNPYKI